MTATASSGLLATHAGPVDTAAIREALRRGVSFLLATQEESGAFPGIVSERADLGGWRAADRSIFDAAGVLRSLRFVGGPALGPLRARTARFLRHEMVGPGLWSYWPRGAARADLPPDADDTACVLDVLGPQLPPATVRAGQIALLSNRTGHEVFKTWLAPENALNDVDSVVNANVVALLGVRRETEAVVRHLSSVVLSPDPRASYWYYAHDAALYYAASRIVATSSQGTGHLRRALLRVVPAHAADSQPVLEAALEACTLLNIGISDGDALARRIARVVAAQRPDGSWPAHAHYAGPRAPLPRSIWFGCEASTSGYCIEALSQFALFRSA